MKPYTFFILFNFI